jgi:hypothetical protein
MILNLFCPVYYRKHCVDLEIDRTKVLSVHSDNSNNLKTERQMIQILSNFVIDVSPEHKHWKKGISWIKISDPWQSLKTKNRIPSARAWCNQLLFKLIAIFDNCIIVKSYKMDNMTIAERAKAVEILVSGCSYGSSYSLYLSVYFVFNISWFLRQFATSMIFLVSLETGMSLSPTTNTHGVF